MICFDFDMVGQEGIFQGATYDNTFVWKQDGVVVDLTGCTARAMGRLVYTDASPVWSITSAAGGIVIDGTAGSVRLILSDTVTAALAANPAQGDLVQIEWDDSQTFQRQRPSLISLATGAAPYGLGMTLVQLDELFTLAATL